MKINEIEEKFNAVEPTDLKHQLSAAEFNSIVQAIKNL